MSSSTKSRVEAAVAALISLGIAQQAIAANTDMTSMQKPGFERCYGIAKKGLNDCGAYNHSCGGFAKRDADPKEFVFVPTGTCKKIVGGSLAPKKSTEKTS